ncbi:type II toxin-antitoxin system VapC family toxin [Leclercia adecarboxylata]|uniref:type II toxin-antitoxin system VapC family toxin n=1 Tax=Leclercia adecarboxylata TaxID=83655 RepID=UPI0012A81A91|nr:PIN domain-containing protein [Leclercia adecarboxylata]QFH65042.1 type II toxin-antitoxin system VapC family toxin [Leclercia adecarboxylata]
MRVIFDTNILVPFLTEMKPNFTIVDPESGELISEVPRRIDALVDRIDNINGTIIIPAPVLAEFLIGIDKEKHQAHINLIRSMSCFEIASFDEMAAIECAQLPTLSELKQMMKSDTANKIKFDRQIISIAKALSIDEVWTHDQGVFKRCKQLGIAVRSLLSVEPPPMQGSIDFAIDPASTNLH